MCNCAEHVLRVNALEDDLAQLREALEPAWEPKAGLIRETLDVLGVRSIMLAPGRVRELSGEVERLRELLAVAADDLEEAGQPRTARYFRERIEPRPNPDSHGCTTLERSPHGP